MTTISTKAALLATAKILGIVGRHDMSKEQLLSAIAAKQATKRVGSSGNKPYRVKYYRLAAPRNIRSSFKTAPQQVKAIICAMYKSEESEMTGNEIGQLAVELGFLKTKQDPHLIFAYYRKQLEVYGLEFAGYGA
jgi:hypothetical protein